MGIQYLWHDHPLEPRSVLSDSKAHCYVCQKPASDYNYKCPKCNFFLHISCLKLPLESLHPLHQDHPLTLLNQPPLDNSENHEIPYNKCNNPCSGFTYHCESCCSFGLHIQCSIEEYSLSLEVHRQHLLHFLLDLLMILSILPIWDVWSQFQKFKPAYKDSAVSSSDLFDAQKYHDNTYDNRREMQLGKDEELAKMRQRFRELLIGKDKPVSDTSHEPEQNFKKLDHFSHEHPLIFCDDYQNNGLMCYGCWLPISRFTYGCTKCNSFLHKWCAKLPLKIQHPMHTEHSLSLLSSEPSYSDCDACGHTLEGFTYTCKSFYFNLHSICASIPRMLRMKSIGTF
ncbi:hypothetical protein ACH5RR_033150 [Cinchona calisaya]|uniref:DC1 domain-containing protein n=1 Tax=Cinchona calisaya TaxID=153742 RepID=A0ABD2YQE8_9GENT